MNTISKQYLPRDGEAVTSVPVVHVIDDDPIFSAAVAYLLQEEGFDCNVYVCAEQFLDMHEPRPVQCGVIDLRLPGMGGLELQHALLTRGQAMPLVIISAFGRTPEIVRAIRNGAVNYLEKPVEDCELIAAVKEAIGKSIEMEQLHGLRQRAWRQLSDRERQVASLFVEARSTIEIAHMLGISPKTVEKHRINIFEKTNVDSVPALMRLMLC